MGWRTDLGVRGQPGGSGSLTGRLGAGSMVLWGDGAAISCAWVLGVQAAEVAPGDCEGCRVWALSCRGRENREPGL